MSHTLSRRGGAPTCPHTRSIHSPRTSSAPLRPSCVGTRACRRLALRLDRAGRAGQGRRQGLVARSTRSRAARCRWCGRRRPTTSTRQWSIWLADRVVSWTHVPGVCPNFTVDEYHDIDHALHEHAEVMAALAARGITDLSLVLFDVWTYGKQVMPEQWRDRRLGWCDIWVRATPTGNPYAHPVSGLKIIVDMNTLEVLEIEDHHDLRLPRGVRRVRPRPSPASPERTDLKPLEITQPEGVSFTLDGNELRWQNWTMRLGFNFREGPVIYQVAFDDPQHSAAQARRRLPDVVRRDGGALPGLRLRPLPADRLRHRRVGSGLHDHLAGARLRLPGRDRLRRCGRAGLRTASPR